MTTVSVPAAITLVLAALAPDVFGSCSLAPPPAPPAPPIEGVIYTPIAPGITYESLPEVVIVDTSPDQIIGCINDTGGNAQGRLNVLFSDAINGDGVIERRNNDIWVYDGALWNNVGPTPGPTIQAATIILPYNETAIYEGRLRLGNDVTKFEYALELLTEVPVLSVTTELGIAVVKIIEVTTVSVAFDAVTPQISISVRVNAPATGISLTAFAPQINTGKTVQVPTMGVDLLALVPDLVGRPRTSVFAPQVDIIITADIPSVVTGASVAVPFSTIALQAQKPSTIGRLDVEAFDLFLLVEDDLLSLRNP
jgi:hypothetical protein